MHRHSSDTISSNDYCWLEMHR